MLSRPPSLLPRIGILAASAASTLALLCVLEAGARALGLGARPAGYSKLLYQRIALPLFAPTTLPDGRPVLGTTDPRLPFQWIESPKPAGVTRIVVLGGSAVAGLGFSPNGSFARELELRLGPQLAAGRRLEVLNLGVVAFASGQVRRMADDVLRHAEPDLLVVYSGNNEFLEPHSDLYARATGRGPNLFQRLLADSHLLRATRPQSGVDRERLQASVSSHDLAANDTRVAHSSMSSGVDLTSVAREPVLRAYERNLSAIGRAAAEAHVPCVVMTVAANERWVGRELEDAAALARSLAGADPSLISATPDIEDCTLALERAPAHARWRLLVLRGELRALEGELEAAREDLLAALESDPNLRRATAEHAACVRRAAEASGALLLDARALLVDLKPWRCPQAPADAGGSPDVQGLVDFAAFYDYVHFTPRGNEAIAVGLIEALWAAGLEHALGLESRSPTAIAADRAASGCDASSCGEGHADAFDAAHFLGSGPGDCSQFASNRDLWKLDATWTELDARLDRDPGDWRAHVWRGNLLFPKPSRREQALADYRAALSAPDVPADVREIVELNVRRLETDRRYSAAPRLEAKVPR